MWFPLWLILCHSTVVIIAAQHGHHHVHKRQASPAVVTQTVIVPVEVYEYNGVPISESEVCRGILNGTLQWAANNLPAPDCSVYLTSWTSNTANTPVKSSSSHMATPTSFSNTANIASPTNDGNSTPTTKPSTSVTHTSTIVPSSPTSSPDQTFNVTNPNVGVDFPDGELDCKTFPSDYGPIEVNWVGHNGWTGIQYAEYSDDSISGLSTGISGNGCVDADGGAITFCSYACPPGYQKSQWPSIQGNSSMAVSVGGLKCDNGKLWLTNPSLSTQLCIEGSGKAFVSNELAGNAAICRTDYPGTEDETVPLDTQAGNIYPLTCPDSSTYYQHLGAQTSAEYYVNNQGITVETACQWDQDGSDEGNWAPVVIGAETDSNGATWLSIMTSRQNDPTNYRELDYSIELEGDFGGSSCFYTQNDGIGYYCSSGNLTSFSPDQPGCLHFDPSDEVTVPGCTVQLFSGTATYHLVETQ